VIEYKDMREAMRRIEDFERVNWGKSDAETLTALETQVESVDLSMEAWSSMIDCVTANVTDPQARVTLTAVAHKAATLALTARQFTDERRV
jgi:hypothetical protein